MLDQLEEVAGWATPGFTMYKLPARPEVTLYEAYDGKWTISYDQVWVAGQYDTPEAAIEAMDAETPNQESS